MQYLKPRKTHIISEQTNAQQAAEPAVQENSAQGTDSLASEALRLKEKKQGIKKIIFPETCSPIWQQAFSLASNVRFTRTPDSEMTRRRAAVDPVYAEILSAKMSEKLESLPRKSEKQAVAEQTEGVRCFVENSGDSVEKTMLAEADSKQPATENIFPVSDTVSEASVENIVSAAAAMAGNNADTVAPHQAEEHLPQQNGFAAETAENQSAAFVSAEEIAEEHTEQTVPYENEAARNEPAENEAARNESVRENFCSIISAGKFSFPWERGENSQDSEQNCGTIMAQPATEADSSILAMQEAKSAATAPFTGLSSGDMRDLAAKPADNPVADSVSLSLSEAAQLFRTIECHYPQVRWIPVPVHIAEAWAAAQLQKTASVAESAAPNSAAHDDETGAVCSTDVGKSESVQRGSANSANNDGDSMVAAPARNFSHIEATDNGTDQENLDVLCSSAVERNADRSEKPSETKSGEILRTAPAANVAVSQFQEKAAVLPQAKEPQAVRREQVSVGANAVASAAAVSPAAKANTIHAETSSAMRQPVAHRKYSYQIPALDLLQEAIYHEENGISQETLERSAGLLENVLEDFGVKGEIIHVRPGPVVTLYEFEPAPGVKSSRVIGLSDDIARSMSSVAARVAVIPGRNVIGIELPNKRREMVYLREILQSQAYKMSDCKLPLALGKNIGGEPVIAELAKMPHLLVAGTTGSGKSVAINTMILSLLYRLTPQECRLIMVDPKMLELSVYDGIPHLLTPVVTDPKKALSALKWAVREMEERYRKMSKLGVRNIDGFNARVKEAAHKGEAIMCNVQAGFDKETGELIYSEEAMDLTPLPYIVVIIDEMADLMMVAGKEIEGAVQRLAQMARAAGIHVIMATQRPSVDVITGTIKANFPTRISFQVTSKIDSRTILGEQGAETLLGQGDMLHMAGGGRLRRIHGPFVSDREVEKVVAYLKTQGTPEYLATVTESSDDEADSKGKTEADDELSAVAEIVAAAGGNEDFDDLYLQAVKIVMRDKKCSTSYIQRRLSIGYNKAATLVEKMEEEGLVGEANHVGKREILING